MVYGKQNLLRKEKAQDQLHGDMKMNTDILDKKEKRKDLIQTLIVAGMIVLLCVTFYGIGYGYGAKSNIDSTYNEVQEWLDKENYCIMDCPKIPGYADVPLLGFNILNKTGENND